MTEEQFRWLVEEKVTAGLPFVSAVYQTMDEAAVLAEPRSWACHKGCSFCCKQMVQVTSGEMAVIVAYLNDLPWKQRKCILKRVWKRVAVYLRWFTRIGGESNPQLQNPIWVSQQWLNKPCPFLSDCGVCSIYPARPIDCRIMHSTTVCKDWDWPDARRFVANYELWANNMILEDEKRRSGRMAVAPIHHWLKAREKDIKP